VNVEDLTKAALRLAMNGPTKPGVDPDDEQDWFDWHRSEHDPELTARAMEILLKYAEQETMAPPSPSGPPSE
jgi:hypothetical protein